MEITTSKFPDIFSFSMIVGTLFLFLFFLSVCVLWTITYSLPSYQATTLARDENRVTNCELLVNTHTFLSILTTGMVLYTKETAVNSDVQCNCHFHKSLNSLYMKLQYV